MARTQRAIWEYGARWKTIRRRLQPRNEKHLNLLSKKEIQEDKDMTFQEWLDKQYYEGFDASGLSDEEYYELEDAYRKDTQEG